MEYKEYIKSKIIQQINQLEKGCYDVGFTKNKSERLKILYNKLEKLK